MPYAASQATPPAAVRTWAATYPGSPAQLAQVRADLRRFLSGCTLTDDVLTLVSELADNAVIHSDSRRPGGTFTVRLTHHHGSHIRAEVQDQGSSWDGDLTASARHPHGLYLLVALATCCGTSRSPRCGTTWFILHYPPPPSAPPLIEQAPDRRTHP